MADEPKSGIGVSCDTFSLDDCTDEVIDALRIIAKFGDDGIPQKVKWALSERRAWVSMAHDWLHEAEADARVAALEQRLADLEAQQQAQADIEPPSAD